MNLFNVIHRIASSPLFCFACIPILTIRCAEFRAFAEPLPEATPSFAQVEVRINAHDYAVIDELAAGNAHDVVPLLHSLIGYYSRSEPRSAHPAVALRAAKVMAQIEGHASILESRIAELSDQPFTGGKRAQLIKTLESVASVESIRVLGALLSDDRIVEKQEYLSSGAHIIANSNLAVQSLTRMQLPNAPRLGQFDAQSPKGLIAWREWWAENEANIDELLESAQSTQPPSTLTPKENLIGKALPPEEPTPTADEPEAERLNTLLYVLLAILVVAIAFVVLRKARKQ